MPASAPPRRKSCDACIKTKRRCDQNSPCARCSAKGIACTYNLIGSSARLQVKTQTQSGPAADVGASINFNQADLEFLDFALPEVGDILVTDHGQEVPYAPLCLSNDHHPERMEYLRDHMKTYSKLFLDTGLLPFLHLKLYEGDFPQAIHEAYAACAVYQARNETTSSLALSTIGAKADNILCIGKTSSWSLKDKVANLQALLILQAIRLFDGNIRLRVLAERDEQTLIEWANDLYASVQSYVSIDIHPWKNWLLLESARRTVTIAAMVQGTYAVEKSGQCPTQTFIQGLPFTLCGGLWHARSAYEWERIHGLYSSRWLSTVSLEMVGQLYESEPHKPELDDFGKVMLGAEYGPEAISRWGDGAITLIGQDCPASARRY